MDDMSGKSIKGYYLKDRIGGGGFGEVYRAEQNSIVREVAIKIIHSTYANHPDFVRRFESEAHLIARLEHPHITPLHDFWRDPDGAYLVMRILKGGSIADIIHKGPLEPKSVRKIVDQVALALDFSHRHEVVHRDIKPDNILLDEDGNAYLADFGIAKDLTGKINHNTSPDAVVGSLKYISPEQVSSQSVTPQSDIYSLGVTIYEMITGEHPFPGCTGVELIYKHKDELLPQIVNVPKQLAEKVNKVIQKATAKDPIKRYTDALSLAKEFREAIGLNGVHRKPTLVEQLTMRQQEILLLMTQNLSNQEIADDLFISKGTVRWHINQMYKTLDVHNRREAIVKARDLNLIVPNADGYQLKDETDSDSISSVIFPEPDNPYKGLHAFQLNDVRDFFGRDDLVEKLLVKMNPSHDFHRFLAIVGPSGSGKSSLVRAGLLPGIERGELDKSDKWFIVDMLPGTHPLDKLETALIKVSTHPSSTIREQLQRDDRGLLRVADIILPEDDDVELVIVVDQFEEVFTLVSDEARRQHFLDLIATSVTDPRSRIRFIVTLRSDYYDRPLHYPEFGELIQSQMETILPLSTTGLERAIRGPAERVGVVFAQGLVEQIIMAVNHQSGTLPLLQYALTELFDRRDDRLLTHEAYQQIGGAVGAIANRADEIYEGFTPEAQDLTRQMFLRLVTLGEGAEDTRRRCTQVELMALTGNPDLLEEIIDQFTMYRLLSLDHDPETRQPTVEVAHEAILRQWKKLRAWLNDSRKDIRLQQLVARSADEWNARKRDPSYLILQGDRLKHIEEWSKTTELALTPLEKEFITACVEAESIRVKIRGGLKVALIALVIVLTIATGVSGHLAVTAQNNFVRAERIRLAAQAQIAFNKGEDARIPALLALRSLQLGYSVDADSALLTALQRGFARQTYVGHTGDGLLSVEFSRDGQQILTSTSDATARLWDTFTGEEIQLFEGHMSTINKAYFVGSTGRIITSSTDGTVRLWDSASGEEIKRVIDYDAPIRTMAVTSDGSQIGVVVDLNTIEIWDVETSTQLIAFSGHDDQVVELDFSPDGKRLASSSFDRMIYIWDVETGEQIQELTGHVARVAVIDFSPDGNLLVSGSEDTTARIWDLNTGDEIDRLVTNSGILGVTFCPNGEFIATASGQDKAIRLWDVETGIEIEQLRGSTTGSGLVACSPDSQYILGGGISNVSRLWEIQLEREPQTYALAFSAAHEEAVQMATYFNNAQQVVSVTGGGDVQIWDADARRIEFGFNTSDAFITDAELIVGNNQVLIATADGRVEVWDILEGTLVRDYNAHNGSVNGVDWAGNRIVSGGDDSSAYLWNLESGETLQHFVGHTNMVTDVAISPDGKRVATSSSDGTARIWDADTGREVQQLGGHNNTVLTIAFSPDGTLVVTGGVDHHAIIWDVDSGTIKHQLLGHSAEVRTAIFSPDGRFVVTGSQDLTARLWRVDTGTVQRQFVGHRFPVRTLSMSEDSDILLAGDLSDVYIWRVDLEDVIELTCQRIANDFTQEERSLYSISDANSTCG